jgi:hypothetical protein
LALEIPALRSDRLPGPEWGTTPQMERFSVSAARLLSLIEDLPGASSLADGLRPLAAGGADVEVFLAPDRGALQLLLDGRRVALSGGARDAVLDLLGGSVQGDPAGEAPVLRAGPDLMSDPSILARAATVGAQIEESRAHPDGAAGGLATPAAPGAPSAMTVRQPLSGAAAAPELARALVRAVAQSGLFLEAHAAQWLRGERDLAALQDEWRALAAGSDGAASPEGRADAQLDALQGQALRLAAQAWPGQPFELLIERDRERHPEAANAGDGTGLFQATLRIELPNLGTLQARIRVTQATVGVQIESGLSEALQPELGSLESALSARGLQVAALALAPGTGGADGR